MRSYGQFCALAKALDAVGDRWCLLIVRELLLLGPCRYTDLLHGLPGIATNLLAARLRDLEEAGIVWREAAGPPVAATLFHLTPRGEALLPVIRELGRWGASLLAAGPKGEEAFRAYWIALPLEQSYHDPMPERPPVTIEARFDDETMTIETEGGRVRARRGSASHPDLVLSGRPQQIVRVLSGRLAPEEAVAQGLHCDGDLAALGRVRPGSPGPPTSNSSRING
jgi:DNA-binding HxlR family transcriptional regulator